MTSRSIDGSPAATHRRRFPRALAVAAALATAFASLAGCSGKTGDNPPPATASARNVTLTSAQRQHVQIQTVAPSSFRRTVEAMGTVDFDNDQATSVLAPFSGPVARLLVVPGQQVAKGQPLATVDSPDFAAAVSAYGKALVTARNARRQADVDKDLVQHSGVAEREEAQAETDAANADADRDAALQALVALDVDAKTIRDIQAGRPVGRVEGVIRAPIAGTVVDKLITPGQLLQAGTTPCFTVANLSRVWVLAQVAASDLASIGVGDPAQVDTGIAGGNLAGSVDNIAATVNADTRAVVARIAVENPKGLLRKQMYVRARIESRQASSGLLVPVSAILRDDENLPFVYAVQADGSFARQHVTLGYRNGDRYLISNGLKAGDRIVVDGSIFVQFMQSQ